MLLNIVRVAVLVPPEVTPMILELIDTLSPVGLVELVRLTVPENPPRLVRVIVDVLVDPRLTCIGGIGVMEKSTMLTVMVTMWKSDPLVALIVTV